MPLTRPAHFSLLTSLYPREHGVLNNTLALPESAATLAEIFRSAGYRTGGFVSVSLLTREAGAGQGFDDFKWPLAGKHRPGHEAVAEALDFIARDGDPFFLWVHLFDPHLPYAPPPEYRSELSPDLAAELPFISWKKLKEITQENDGDVPREIFDHAKALYRGEVSYVDRWIGELLGGLDRAREPDSTIVVFTADHGECFEDGVYFIHSDCLNPGAIHIPLIIRYSDFAPGSQMGGQVSLIDVAPTILRAAGMAVPAEFSGRVLQEQSEEEDRYVLLQHPFYQDQSADGRTHRKETIRSVAGEPTKQVSASQERVAILGRSWKLIQTGGETELYALDANARLSPTEKARGSDADRVEQLAAQLRAKLDRHPLTILDAGQINAELRETLRALGYLEDSDALDVRER